MGRPDVLYVKLKEDSPFTVSRAQINSMADYFQQDATFVTHFALARLRAEIAQGKITQATDIPVATRFLAPAQIGKLRQHVHDAHGTPELTWEANPALDSLLSQ